MAVQPYRYFMGIVVSNEPNFLDDDPAYMEWSQSIEVQNQQQQEADMAQVDDYVLIDLSQKTWPEIMALFNATKA